MSADPDEPLCLDQFLKLRGAVGTGGEAKVMIQSGEVKLNGQIETRRRKKLQKGDIVEIDGQQLRVGDSRYLELDD
ncbi:MAG: hypothetical protein JWM11_4384 [Planctomycetaceae bacterium]|nr:hypothetical protein [Planctomycetaceae bacterium]